MRLLQTDHKPHLITYRYEFRRINPVNKWQILQPPHKSIHATLVINFPRNKRYMSQQNIFSRRLIALKAHRIDMHQRAGRHHHLHARAITIKLHIWTQRAKRIAPVFIKTQQAVQSLAQIAFQQHHTSCQAKSQTHIRLIKAQITTHLHRRNPRSRPLNNCKSHRRIATAHSNPGKSHRHMPEPTRLIPFQNAINILSQQRRIHRNAHPRNQPPPHIARTYRPRTFNLHALHNRTHLSPRVGRDTDQPQRKKQISPYLYVFISIHLYLCTTGGHRDTAPTFNFSSAFICGSKHRPHLHAPEMYGLTSRSYAPVVHHPRRYIFAKAVIHPQPPRPILPLAIAPCQP